MTEEVEQTKPLGDVAKFSPPSCRVVVLLTFIAVYFPYSWLLFVKDQWQYRLTWIKMWPELPGVILMFFAQALTGMRNHFNTGAVTMHLVCSHATICFLGLALVLALRFRQHAWKILACVAVVSMILGAVAYGLFAA